MNLVEAIDEKVPSTIITDGAYASEETSRMAAGKNITLLTMGFLGRKTKEILGQFVLDESGYMLVGCPAMFPKAVSISSIRIP